MRHVRSFCILAQKAERKFFYYKKLAFNAYVFLSERKKAVRLTHGCKCTAKCEDCKFFPIKNGRSRFSEIFFALGNKHIDLLSLHFYMHRAGKSFFPVKIPHDALVGADFKT